MVRCEKVSREGGAAATSRAGVKDSCPDFERSPEDRCGCGWVDGWCPKVSFEPI